MEIELDLKKSLEANASDYFEKGKKAKAKAKRIEAAIKKTEKKLSKAGEEKPDAKLPRKKRKREWFEKFHWFYSSEGFLVIAGRDAHSNESVVKKHMDKDDVYFHAEIQGAAHCIVKTDGKKPGKATKKEAAKFAAVFSKAWPSSIASIDVYSVKPEQVSKKAPSGEALGTGAFMIYGKREWFRGTPLEFSVGAEKKDESFRVISGPPEAVKANALLSLDVKQGEKDKGGAAKEVKKIIESRLEGAKFDLDEIVAMLPAGKILISHSKH